MIRVYGCLIEDHAAVFECLARRLSRAVPKLQRAGEGRESKVERAPER